VNTFGTRPVLLLTLIRSKYIVAFQNNGLIACKRSFAIDLCTFEGKVPGIFHDAWFVVETKFVGQSIFSTILIVIGNDTTSSTPLYLQNNGQRTLKISQFVEKSLKVKTLFSRDTQPPATRPKDRCHDASKINVCDLALQNGHAAKMFANFTDLHRRTSHRLEITSDHNNDTLQYKKPCRFRLFYMKSWVALLSSISAA